MKHFLLFLLLFLPTITRAQLLYPYKDTTYNYYIGLPETWRYWTITDKPGISMISREVNPVIDSTKQFPTSINISIVNHPGISVDSAFIYLTAATAQSRLQILDTGSYTVNGKKMLWFDDVHIGSSQEKDTLSASDFVVYSKDRAYIITCTSTTRRFSESRELFHRVAQTFKPDLPAKQELIKITLPGDRKWRMYMDSDDSTTHFKQVLPVNEMPEHWTTVVSLISEKMTGNQNIENILSRYSAQIRKPCKNSKYALLAKSEKSALFKVECADADPEGNLCYLTKGATRWHILFFSLHQSTLPADVIKQWTEIFQQAKIVIE